MHVAAPRGRLAVACALGATIALGLLSRRFPLPGVFAEHTGDALYTCAVFGALAFAAPAARSLGLGLVAWLLSAAVEVSQLLSWQWLADVRATRLGALLLGQGWQWQDLVAYAFGAAAAAALDACLRRAGVDARRAAR